MFLNVIQESFDKFIESGSSRSNSKLKPLHGYFAKRISDSLGPEYSVKSLGFGDGKEYVIDGKFNKKKVDITVINKERVVAGIGVKFIMQNYHQNSNNYFESMIGETVNAKMAGYLYYQVVIMLDHMPYYNTHGEIKKWETITDTYLSKYAVIGKEDPNNVCIPNGLLLCAVKMSDVDARTKTDYLLQHPRCLGYSDFGSTDYGHVILNNCDQFVGLVLNDIHNECQLLL